MKLPTLIAALVLGASNDLPIYLKGNPDYDSALLVQGREFLRWNSVSGIGYNDKIEFIVDDKVVCAFSPNDIVPLTGRDLRQILSAGYKQLPLAGWDELARRVCGYAKRRGQR